MEYIFPKIEDLTPQNNLPDLFISQSGEKINDTNSWEKSRPYNLALLEHFMYGTVPAGDFNVKGDVIFSERVNNKKSIHEFVRIKIENADSDIKLSIFSDIIRPNDSERHRTIVYTAFPNARDYKVEEEIVRRGYALAMFNYEQLAPDENITDASIYRMFENCAEKPKAIGLWAFCAMRLADYLDTTPYSKRNEYIMTGHSRNGKAALCAGIYDKRFMVTVPNNSGCGGCGCFRILGSRNGITQDPAKTETLERITKVFPHWFSENLNKFYDKESEKNSSLNNLLPFDLHLNKALIAPRYLLSLEAYGDEWANPYGSKLTHEAAKKVFELYGKGENIEIQFREGGHEFGYNDFIKLLDFCDKIG